MLQYELSSKPHHQHRVIFLQLTACTYHLRPCLFYILSLTSYHALSSYLSSSNMSLYKQYMFINSEISVLITPAYHLFLLFALFQLIQHSQPNTSIFGNNILNNIQPNVHDHILWGTIKDRETAWINLELTYQN